MTLNVNKMQSSSDSSEASPNKMYRAPTLMQQGCVSALPAAGGSNEGFDVPDMLGFEWMEAPEPKQKPVPVRPSQPEPLPNEEHLGLSRLEDIYKEIKRDLLKAQKEQNKHGTKLVVLKEDYEDLLDSECGMTSGDDSEDIKCEEHRI